MRPQFVTEDDLARWSKIYEEESRVALSYLPSTLLDSPLVKEVCFAGMWLCEELEKMGCASDKIIRIQFTAGEWSFGRDPWEAHQEALNAYRNNELIFEEEPAFVN